jgi:hypothetical protein
MTSLSETNFKLNYQTHLKHLKLKGLQPKTIAAYSRAMRRVGAYFGYQINDLSEPQLTDYFSDLLESLPGVASNLICTVLNSSMPMF